MKPKRGEPFKLPMMYRSADFVRDSIDVENRTVELSFSSETPVERWYGYEVLGHKRGEIRLDRIRGGPLLVSHNRNDLTGVVESVKVQERTGRAVVRFGRSARAEEIFQDVQDGIRTTTSTGYRVHRLDEIPTGDDETPRFRAVDWEPYEISLEPIPADLAVGVGRNEDEGQNYDVAVRWHDTELETRDASVDAPPAEREERDMPEEKPTTPPVDEGAIRKAATDSETERVDQILALGDKFGQADLAREAIKKGTDVDGFREMVLEKIDEERNERPTPDLSASRTLDLPEKDRKQYSIANLVRALAFDDWREAGLEKECSDEVEKRVGSPPRGAYVPEDAMWDSRWLEASRVDPLVVGTDGAGGYLKGTNLMASAFIETLRAKAVALKAGVRVLDGLVGDVTIPRQATGGTAYWIATEGNAPTGEANPTFELLTLQPKELGAYQGMTRKLLLQSTPAIDRIVRDDLTTILALAIDQAILRGSGASGQPTGIAATGSIGSVSCGATVGGPLTWPLVVEFETDVASGDADVANMAYITTPKVKGHCKVTSRAGTEAVFLMDDNGTMNGFPVLTTTQLRDTLAEGGSGEVLSEMIFGNFADALLGMWGGLDLKVDEAHLRTSGGLVLRVFQSTDVGVRHAASFSYSADINAA